MSESTIPTPPPLLVVFPRGQLSPEDKATMRDAGIIAIEADDPKSVHQVHLSAPMFTSLLHGDDLVRAAMRALCSTRDATIGGTHSADDHQRNQFVRLLTAAIAPKDPSHG